MPLEHVVVENRHPAVAGFQLQFDSNLLDERMGIWRLDPCSEDHLYPRASRSITKSDRLSPFVSNPIRYFSLFDDEVTVISEFHQSFHNV